MNEHTSNILAQYDKKITKLNISNKNIVGILDLNYRNSWFKTNVF